MNIKVLGGFFKKEIIALLRDPILMMAILIMPVVQMVVLAGAITFQADNLKIIMDARPNDVMMNQIYNHAIGTGLFIPVNADKIDPVAAVQGGMADVAIIAPDGGFTHDVAQGNAEIQILIDSMNILKAHSIEAYLRGIIAKTIVDATGTELLTPIDMN